LGYINLSKDNFFHNLDYFSKLCGSNEKLCIALKDNAYGHGINEISTLCKEYGVKHVFVRDESEYNQIKDLKFKSILVLYDIFTCNDNSITFSINSLKDLHKISNGSKIELKIDTGMNRNGIDEDEIDEALDIINKKDLFLYGVFTHFCCADEDNEITQQQEEKFLSSIAYIKTTTKKAFRIHCANSAGVHKVDMSKYEIARIGIGAYGYVDIDEDRFLRPVLSLHANKITTKKSIQGSHIGYGSDAYILAKDMVISNYDIGYGDGFLRLSENKKASIANGKKILGRVSMDSFFVEGDDESVTVFDNVKELAKVHSTINYEILTSLKPSIQRNIV
jgi:alanine racemase